MISRTYKLNKNPYQKANIAYGASAIGRKDNNEDYFSVFIHPNNSNYIMSVVADGVGGYVKGEVASKYATKRLGNFFKRQPDFNINGYSFVNDLSRELERINKEMVCRFLGQTTLSCAITTRDNIIIANVGDSRVYLDDEEGCHLVTRDQSEVYEQLCMLNYLNPDDLRFVRGNNVLTNCLGCHDYRPAEVAVIPKKYICQILLTTDGVSDILSSAQLFEIIQNTEDKAALEIIKQAIEKPNEHISEDLQELIYSYDHIPRERLSSGKDNATAVLTKVPRS